MLNSTSYFFVYISIPKLNIMAIELLFVQLNIIRNGVGTKTNEARLISLCEVLSVSFSNQSSNTYVPTKTS